MEFLDNHVVAYVTGHTHENELRPCARAPGAGGCPAGARWWEINSSATADWPQQTRLIELMDNRDATLSFFGTMLDYAAPTGVPSPGGAGLGDGQLASLGRLFSYNDPQAEKAGPGKPFGAIGGPEDRNAELIVVYPRRSAAGLRRRLRVCGMPVGRIAGRRVGRALLGRTRRRNRRAFRSVRRLRRGMDRSCMVGGGFTRIGTRTAGCRAEPSSS